MNIKQIILILCILINVSFIYAAIGDPTKFLNASNIPTVYIGGNEGIGNFSGKITTDSFSVKNAPVSCSGGFNMIYWNGTNSVCRADYWLADKPNYYNGTGIFTSNGAFKNTLYVGNSSKYTSISNVTTKAGMFLPVKYIGVDSAGNDDSGFVFGYENNPMWDWSTFVSEQARYVHLINYQSGGDALTIGQSGRIGINKPSNVMNYHNGFNGVGLDDLYVGGTFTGGFNDIVEINVTNTSNPNTFSYRITVQNGVSFSIGSWSASANMSLTPVTLYKGITVKWDNVTGHTIGDRWNFNAFPANPTGTFTVKPTIYDEVSYYNGSKYFDYTSPAATSALGSLINNPFTIFGTTGKYLYAGRYVKFSSSNFDISTPATGLTLKTEYWNGANWTAMNFTTNYLTDSTANLTKSGGINWDNTVLVDWQTNVSVDTYNSTSGLYWIRYSTTSVGTAPLISSVTPQAISRIAIYQAGYDVEPVFNVAQNGDTIIKGTLLANGFYAELYNTSTSTQSLPNNAWANITSFNIGDLSGWTVTQNYILTCTQAGLYDVSYAINGAVGGNDVLTYQILVNNVLEPKGDMTVRYTTGLALQVSTRLLKRFSTGDVVLLQIRDTSSARTFTYDNKNILMTRVGN